MRGQPQLLPSLLGSCLQHGYDIFSWILKSFHTQDMPKLSLVFTVSLACSACLYPSSGESNDSGHVSLMILVFSPWLLLGHRPHHLSSELMAETPHWPFLSHIFVSFIHSVWESGWQHDPLCYPSISFRIKLSVLVQQPVIPHLPVSRCIFLRKSLCVRIFLSK